MHSLQCKLCSKQGTGRNIAIELESQFFTDLTTKVIVSARATKVKAWRKCADGGRCRIGGTAAEKMMYASSREHEELTKTLKQLTVQQKDVSNQYASVCGLFEKTTNRLENMQNERKRIAAPLNNTKRLVSSEQLTDPNRGLSAPMRVEQVILPTKKEIADAKIDKRAVASHSKQKVLILMYAKSKELRHRERIKKYRNPGVESGSNYRIEYSRFHIFNTERIAGENCKMRTGPGTEPLLVDVWANAYGYLSREHAWGPLGRIGKALNECFPRLALLRIDFIGCSVLEVITNAGLVTRILGTLVLVSILPPLSFVVLEAAALKTAQGKITLRHKLRKLKTANGRP